MSMGRYKFSVSSGFTRVHPANYVYDVIDSYGWLYIADGFMKN